MKKISKKLSKKIMAVMLAVAMAVGVTAGVRVVMDSSFADELGKFDPVFYAAAYTDVAAALGTDANALYSHYQNYGQKEGRVPYAGAAAGEAVDGIAGTDNAAASAAQAPAADIGDGPYFLTSGEEVDKATFLQKKQELQQKFDADGYVHVGWTEDQVQAKLFSLKEKYPEGMKIGKCGVGATQIGFALYGSIPATNVGTAHDEWIEVDGRVRCVVKTLGTVSLKDIARVGDVLYTTGADPNGHVSIILSRDEEGITVVESNWGNDQKMHWGRRITWEDLGNDINTVYQRSNAWHQLHHYLY